MKKTVQFSPTYVTNSIQGFKKLNNQLVKPLKVGFLGFTTILMIIIIINLLSLIIGYNEKFGMDSLDFLLAGTGFVLQMTGTLVKSFIR